MVGRGGQFAEEENPGSWKRGGVTLEEKYFRRVAAFEGDFAKDRGWLFDLNVAIGQVDKEFAGELERLVKTTEQDKWRPEEDRFLRRDLYSKYKENYMGCCVQPHKGNRRILLGTSLTHTLNKMDLGPFWL